MWVNLRERQQKRRAAMVLWDPAKNVVGRRNRDKTLMGLVEGGVGQRRKGGRGAAAVR